MVVKFKVVWFLWSAFSRNSNKNHSGFLEQKAYPKKTHQIQLLISITHKYMSISFNFFYGLSGASKSCYQIDINCDVDGTWYDIKV
jgi:hypothetical protein